MIDSKWSLWELPDEVKNPAADRRSKYLLAQPIIPTGTKFIREEWSYKEKIGMRTEIRYYVYSRGWHSNYNITVRQYEPLYDPLVAALVPVTPTDEQWAVMTVKDHQEVLHRLLELKLVTLEQLQTAQVYVENIEV